MSHVKYIDKTREYYLGQGYEKPYEWAHFDDVPFARLNKPLSEARISLVSTSDITVRGQGDDGDHADELFTGNVYSIAADTPLEQLYSRQQHYDKHATNLDDVDSYFPITRLHEAAAEGRIGGVAPRLHGVFTAYSHRRTLTMDGPEVLARCREDGVDAVVLTPIWPVCHQTVSLVARYLEENGIPTVVFANARDIVEYCGVPRLLFVDYPLGNPCGRPFQVEEQRRIFGLALDLLQDATAPRSTVQAPQRWPGGEEWKRLIFSDEQPFLEGEDYDDWMDAKKRYKALKEKGEV